MLTQKHRRGRTYTKSAEKRGRKWTTTPPYRTGSRRSAQWESLVGKEFQDAFSEIDSDDGKVPPEQLEREKRLEKRQRFGIGDRENGQFSKHIVTIGLDLGKTQKTHAPSDAGSKRAKRENSIIWAGRKSTENQAIK